LGCSSSRSGSALTRRGVSPLRCKITIRPRSSVST
jgi:hypothetical protein